MKRRQTCWSLTTSPPLIGSSSSSQIIIGLLINPVLRLTEYRFELRLEVDSVEESVCTKTPNVGECSEDYRQPPSSTERGQTFGENVMVCKEGGFDSPDAGEEQVGICPLILGVRTRDLLIGRRLGEVTF